MSQTSSSTQAHTNPSDSAPRGMQQAVTEASLPLPHPPYPEQNNMPWLEKWVVPIMGMILTAVVAYFSAFIAVKEDISNNKNNISLLQKDLKYTSEKLTDMKSDISSAKTNNSEIMVLKTKVESLEYDLREHNKAEEK